MRSRAASSAASSRAKLTSSPRYETVSKASNVTDKGKEQVGARPDSTYAPQAGHASAAEEHPTLAQPSGAAAAGGAAGSTAEHGARERVLFRTGDIVSVRSAGSQMWLAELKQPVIMVTEVTPSGAELASFAEPRVPCRYFVTTMELFAPGLAHAAAFWSGLCGPLGGQLHLADEAAALARAAASEGVHYSYEKSDHVTCTTVSTHEKTRASGSGVVSYT